MRLGWKTTTRLPECKLHKEQNRYYTRASSGPSQNSKKKKKKSEEIAANPIYVDRVHKKKTFSFDNQAMKTNCINQQDLI